MMGFNSFLRLLQQLNVFAFSFLPPSSFHFTVTMGHCRFCLSFLFLVILVPTSTAQLRPTQTTLIFQVQKLLEYPEALQGWNNWTNFCFLPPSPSLSIVCSGDRVTELTISGNKTTNKTRHTLSHSFDIDSFFTALTKLSDLKVLSLVSLGLWGPLPAKINRLQSLQVLNLSSNSIRGRIPSEISSLKSLKSLVLADNLFNASVPDLRGLAQLQELNLGRNNLGPDFPSLPKNLTTLILKNNSFRSEIPSGIKGFDQLRQLDISSNEFLGLVPSFLFSLPSIQFLNLGANQLTGALPANTTCTKNLTFVDISHNLLIGKLPSCVSSSSSNRTVISSWNCLSGGNLNQQHTSSYCNKVALAVEPPSRTTEQGSTRLALGVVLAIIGGIVGLVAVAAAVILVILRRSETTRADNTKYDGFIPKESPVGASLRPVIDSRRVPQTMRSAAIGLPQYRVFALEEIEDATNNFDQSNLMGEDSQGKLYKGWLGDGSVAVIKCVKLKQRHLSQNLMQNMEALSKLRHQHLVSVLGHCMVTYAEHPNTASTVFIVLEHISNGCLRDYLTDWRRKDMLKWPQRMAITIGAARGIQFLHTGVAPGIFGNNLKMENILLDETLTAKLSNYHIPLLPKVDAESPLSSDANAEKEDIYQLGVILLEVITGKQVESTGELEGLKLELEMSLTEGPSKVRDLIDPSIRGTFAYESMRTTIEFAIKCLCKDSSKRPSVEDVLWNLQYSIQVQEGWNSSGNLNAQPLWYDL